MAVLSTPQEKIENDGNGLIGILHHAEGMIKEFTI